MKKIAFAEPNRAKNAIAVTARSIVRVLQEISSRLSKMVRSKKRDKKFESYAEEKITEAKKWYDQHKKYEDEIEDIMWVLSYVQAIGMYLKSLDKIDKVQKRSEIIRRLHPLQYKVTPSKFRPAYLRTLGLGIGLGGAIGGYAGYKLGRRGGKKVKKIMGGKQDNSWKEKKQKIVNDKKKFVVIQHRHNYGNQGANEVEVNAMIKEWGKLHDMLHKQVFIYFEEISEAFESNNKISLQTYNNLERKYDLAKSNSERLMPAIESLKDKMRSALPKNQSNVVGLMAKLNEAFDDIGIELFELEQDLDEKGKVNNGMIEELKKRVVMHKSDTIVLTDIHKSGFFCPYCSATLVMKNPMDDAIHCKCGKNFNIIYKYMMHPKDKHMGKDFDPFDEFEKIGLPIENIKMINNVRSKLKRLWNWRHKKEEEKVGEPVAKGIPFGPIASVADDAVLYGYYGYKNRKKRKQQRLAQNQRYGG